MIVKNLQTMKKITVFVFHLNLGYSKNVCRQKISYENLILPYERFYETLIDGLQNTMCGYFIKLYVKIAYGTIKPRKITEKHSITEKMVE